MAAAGAGAGDECAIDARLRAALARIDELEQLVTRRDAEQLRVEARHRRTAAYLARLLEIIPSPLLVVAPDGAIEHASRATSELLDLELPRLVGSDAEDVWPGIYDATEAGRAGSHETTWRHRDGTPVPVLVSASPLETADGPRLVCVGLDLRARHRLEIERRHAAKLESLGQLAAGVAHEINTPMQFISDNVHFLRDGCRGLLQVVAALRTLRDAAAAGELAPAHFQAAEQAEVAADLGYVTTRLDRAFTRTLDGIGRISSIVSAMKVFSHPGHEKAPVDLNEMVRTTLTVARNEYKYVATAVTELGEVPAITAHGGDLAQVLLNLVVNAAHAIADAARPELGTITIRTAVEGDVVVVSVADTGCGIDPDIRRRVFDPFFTTKAPGRGTGQGLALAHAVVVEHHRGQIGFETEVGRGTTFWLRLPLDDRSRREPA
jgi:two-component system NtrC family sensor kinase